MHVDGEASLDGALQVSLVDGFQPKIGNRFDILDFGSSTGAFSGLAEGGLVGNFGGANLLITYLGGDGNDVTLLAALPGDFDLDGDADGFDFIKWQSGESPNPFSASDLVDWEANYGAVSQLVAVGTVPEPSISIKCNYERQGVGDLYEQQLPKK